MIGKLFTMAVLTGGATLALGVLPASAHYPEVTATNACVDGHPAIEVRATAWQTDLPNDHRMNRNVRVDISGPHTSDGVTGLFVAPDFWSQAEFAVPDAVGDTLTARATAIDAWGPNGEYGYAGTYRETTIDVVDVCHTDVAPPWLLRSPVSRDPCRTGCTPRSWVRCSCGAPRPHCPRSPPPRLLRLPKISPSRVDRTPATRSPSRWPCSAPASHWSASAAAERWPADHAPGTTGWVL
jgi:hypothetical protein